MLWNLLFRYKSYAVNTYIALFRGINIGGKHLLPMKELSRILEELGCENVRTYIQSGNAVFSTRKNKTTRFADEISSKILQHYGFEPKVLLLKTADLEKAIRNNPFHTDEGKTLHLFFMESKPPKPDLKTLMDIKLDSEVFILKNNIFYLYTPEGVGRSKLASRVEHCLGVPVTARNWNTVTKLIEMARGS